MGEQRDSNLFHSFERFGIGALETATFTGPDGIDNVISRVTGGDESRIDGTLRSTIPGADVWLLNPSGIVEVSTPDVELAGNLTVLPTSYLDAASLMRERCAARRSGERAGSFSVRGNGGIPAEPDGRLPATVSFDAAPGSNATSDLPASPGGVPLFALGGCR